MPLVSGVQQDADEACTKRYHTYLTMTQYLHSKVDISQEST